MTITAFDKSNLRTVRSDIDAALRAVEDKHGIRLTIGNIRFDAGQFRTKLEATVSSPSRTAAVLNAAMAAQTPSAPVSGGLAAQLIAAHGARAAEHGALFKVPTHKSLVRIVGYKPTRPKYPFVYETENGTKWKMSAEDMRRSVLMQVPLAMR